MAKKGAKGKKAKKTAQKGAKAVKRFLDGINVAVQGSNMSNESKAGDTAVGYTKRANIPPLAYGATRLRRQAPTLTMARGGDSALVSGSDYLTTLNINNHNAGDVRFVADINPTLFGLSSRLAQMAILFEKWRINKLKFMYQPAVGSTTVGQLIHYIEYDAANSIPSTGVTNVQIGAAHRTFQPFSVWQPSDVSYDRKANDVELYTSPQSADDRMSQAGQYVVICSTNFTGTLSPGVVYVEYDIEFYMPQVGITAPSQPVGYISSATGVDNSNVFGTNHVFVYNYIGAILFELGTVHTLSFPAQGVPLGSSSTPNYRLYLTFGGASPSLLSLTVNANSTPGWTITQTNYGASGTGLIFEFILYKNILTASDRPLLTFGSSYNSGTFTSFREDLYPIPVALTLSGMRLTKRERAFLQEIEDLKSAVGKLLKASEPTTDVVVYNGPYGVDCKTLPLKYTLPPIALGVESPRRVCASCLKTHTNPVCGGTSG